MLGPPLNAESASTVCPEGPNACCPSHRLRLAGVARRRVLSSSLCGEPDGVPLMVMRQTRLLCRRDNILCLPKLGGLAMVPCGVLVMLSRQLMKFAQP